MRRSTVIVAPPSRRPFRRHLAGWKPAERPARGRRYLIAVSLLFIAAACRERAGGSEEVARVAKTTTPTAASGVTTTPPPGGVTIRRADGSEVVVIHRTGENMEIRYGGTVLNGESRESGKRKYRSGNGPVVFEIKPNENGFKLRTADGALRWKVKISADKIKISDNEENNNPFELKRKEGDRVKVVAPGERELGAVRGTAVEDANKKELFRIDGGGASSAAYGVLLLDPIPEMQRYILLAELLSRER